MHGSSTIYKPKQFWTNMWVDFEVRDNRDGLFTGGTIWVNYSFKWPFQRFSAFLIILHSVNSLYPSNQREESESLELSCGIAGVNLGLLHIHSLVFAHACWSQSSSTNSPGTACQLQTDPQSVHVCVSEGELIWNGCPLCRSERGWAGGRGSAIAWVKIPPIQRTS